MWTLNSTLLVILGYSTLQISQNVTSCPLIPRQFPLVSRLFLELQVQFGKATSSLMDQL